VILTTAAALLLASPPAEAAPAAVPGAEGVAPNVDTLLHERLHDKRIGHHLAMIVTDAVTGEVISENLPDSLMQPASNMKVITAVNALATMGPDRLFVTRVLSAPTPGEVILQGGGDPLLSRREVKSLADQTAQSLGGGSSVIVHVDGDLFPSTSRAPGWVAQYIGSSTGLVQALAIRGDYSTHPSRNAADVFVQQLRSRGIQARIGPNLDAAPDAPALAVTPGHSVASAVGVMLNESESMVAEVLFRHTAIASGQPPTWEGGQAAAKQTLATLGLDPTPLLLFDGSGLSRADRITPRFLSDVLRIARVAQPDRFAAMFVPGAMPVSGLSGTLTARYGRYSTKPSKCARGLVQAKTGTILSTIALSGLAWTVYGGAEVFSIMVNDRPVRFPVLSTRRAVDGLAATITGCWR
jgi:D-alanyl-D-alanine carboxypeptidase/D-alanyl-D-alanine-endopeptidase (penicillin-binding protein 4)